MVKRRIPDTDKIVIKIEKTSPSKKLKTASSSAPLLIEDASSPIAPALGECIRSNVLTEADVAEDPTPDAIGDTLESDSSESDVALSADRSCSDDESGDEFSEQEVPKGSCSGGPYSVKFEWADNGSTAEAGRFYGGLSDITKGLNGVVDTILFYESKLAAADAAVKASKTEARRLRRDNAALAKSERSWLALQEELAALKKDNALLLRLASKVEGLRAKNKELRENLANDAEKVMLKAEIAALKELGDSNAKKYEIELARPHGLKAEELHRFAQEIFKRTKAFFTPLLEKVRAYLAERNPMVSALLVVTRHESVLASLHALEEAGVKLPEGFKDRVELLYEQAKTDLVTDPRVEITDQDLAEPGRFVFKKILDEVRQTSREGAAGKTAPLRIDEDEGEEPK